MATAAFKSTTKRTPMAPSSASSADDSTSSIRNSSSYRRSRSLSRFSRRFPAQDTCNGLGDLPSPRGKFVNTTRGYGFPEISLDDLAIELSESGNRGRMASRHSKASPASGTAASQRRGRSVSSRSTGIGNDGRGNVGNSSGGRRLVPDANPRRRRSVSVVRYQISDSESDLDHPHNVKSRVNVKSSDIGSKLSHKPVDSSQKPLLRKSLSQKDLRSYDGYSSQSSVLTDDEGTGAHFNEIGIEKMRGAYAQKKPEHPEMNSGLHKAMRKELRHAVDSIKMEIKRVVAEPGSSTLTTADRLLSNNSDVIQAVASIRRNYETKLEKSEKRKQDLLAEIVLEEQRGRELSEVVDELLPESKNKAAQKPSIARKRSNDKSGMSKRLTEEAEKYIEEFISNIEDTDISSLDGERSDTSSSIVGLITRETFTSPPMPRSLPVQLDGVVLPWLQWETSDEASLTTSLSKTQTPATPKTASSTQEIAKAQNQSNHSVSSRGSWSPDGFPTYVRKDISSESGESYSYPRKPFSVESKGLRYDIDEHLKAQDTEDFLIERWRQRHRIKSGSLLLCNLRLN